MYYVTEKHSSDSAHKTTSYEKTTCTSITPIIFSGFLFSCKMVTKSPKKQILGKRQFKKKNTNLRVHVQKLDENVYEAYRNRLIGMYGVSNEIANYFDT